MDDDEMMFDDDEVVDGGEEDEEGAEVEIENKYYNAKGLLEDDPVAAIKDLEDCVKLDTEKGEWGFKALKKLCKLYYNRADHANLLAKFEQLCQYGNANISSNVSEKGLTSILDMIGVVAPNSSGSNNNSKGKGGGKAVSAADELKLIESVYGIALKQLKKQKNERTWFRTNLKFGKLLYDRNEHQKLAKVLQELRVSCQTETGEDDKKKGSQLVDLYALEIQMYTATKNNKKLKELYHKALSVESAIALPKIMGVIRECGGKMHMREKDWKNAQADFFEAFKNFDEAGSAQKIQCLKYLVLASMLSLSEVNPFEAVETRPYKNDPEIVAMTSLVGAYERSDIKQFEKILRDNQRTIVDDPFIRDYIDDLLKNIRTQVLLRLLKPYTHIRIAFVSAELNISDDDVRGLMVALILDQKIRGKIDMINSMLELEPAGNSAASKFRSIHKWASQIDALQSSLQNRLS